MNIGQAAARSGVPAKTIRYYEEIGLIAPAARSDGGYRVYGDRDVAVLRFLKRARGLGFGVEECRGLLALYRDAHRASADVQALARRRVTDIEHKIAELQAMRATLTDLIARCHGDEHPECAILDDLAGEAERGEEPAGYRRNLQEEGKKAEKTS